MKIEDFIVCEISQNPPWDHILRYFDFVPGNSKSSLPSTGIFWYVESLIINYFQYWIFWQDLYSGERGSKPSTSSQPVDVEEAAEEVTPSSSDVVRTAMLFTNCLRFMSYDKHCDNHKVRCMDLTLQVDIATRKS